MTMKTVFAALAIAAGVAAAMQAATNAGLSKSAGLGPALVVNTVIVLIGALGLWAAMGARTTFFPAGASWTLYVGGLFGFVIIASLGVIFPDSTALALSLHPDVAGSASAYFGTLRLGLGALATPLIGIGGVVSGLSMGLVIALSGILAVALFAVVAPRTRDEEVIVDMPEEAAADMPVA